MKEKIISSADALIGNTPLLSLSHIAEVYAKGTEILAKCEWLNPGGSVKDRVAKAILDQAEREGKLQSDTLVIEPTSGNTGIGLASLCAVRGYRALLVMPENMSQERIKILRAYGAEVVLTPKEKGMAGAVAYAKERQTREKNAMIFGQFENPQNPLAHYHTTGPEILDATNGKIDAFVATVGTGGTLTGTGKYLKEKIEGISVYAVEPAASPMLSEGKSGAHKIQGIGAGFVPATLDTDVYDGILTVTDEEAYHYARELARLEGILVGISSGAAVCGAIKLAKEKGFAGKRIVTVLPDSGSRYLSTDLFM